MFNFTEVQLSEQIPSNWAIDAFSCHFPDDFLLYKNGALRKLYIKKKSFFNLN